MSRNVIYRELPPEFVSELLSFARRFTDVTRTLRDAILAIQRAKLVRSTVVLRADHGQWLEVASAGNPPAYSRDILNEVLDGETAMTDGDWVIVPLREPPDASQLLLLYDLQTDGANADYLAEWLSSLLADVLAIVRERLGNQNQVERLKAVLAIAAEWNEFQDTQSLLQQMAEASTKLLDAERASIFIWDRPNKTLVGRPALGVEGGVLRVPDDTGVVGQVVHSGEMRRVDADVDADQIDRSVDKKLDFHTRSLLCAPLWGPRGKILGAFEMINKRHGNFTKEDEIALQELAAHAAVALQHTQQYEKLVRTRDQLAEQAAERVLMIGNCPVIQALRSTVKRVANTELAVMILGENGTGKEVIAQMVHYLSNRRNETFVAVNCAALPETLLESELFGHEKGAFTDAREARAGKFELASGGTLFLDEIGDMSLNGQAKLLRVLEEKIVVRVGGSQPIHTDARVIAATNQDLSQLVRERRFREDLYFRLNVVTLELPPLRDRGDDIVMLAEHFLKEFSTKARRQTPQLSAAAKRRLLTHAWPGNVRELRNMMERIAYLTEGDNVDVDQLAFILSPAGDGPNLFEYDLTLAEATQEFQSQYIKTKIKRSRGNMTDAAETLGLHRSNLYRKMRQLGMSVDEVEH